MMLSIIIPIYNAENLIQDSIARLYKSLSQVNLDFEILLRDDGSGDYSKNILCLLEQQYPSLRCFYNESNKGLGFTLRELMASAQGENILYLDIDLPFSERIISIILRELECYDVVVASRYLKKRNFWGMRAITSRLYYYLCKSLFDVPVLDIGSGTVGIRRKAVEFLDLKTNRFDFHIEFFTKARQQGLAIKEISATSFKTHKGSFRIFRHGPQVVFDTLKFWLTLEKTRNQSKVIWKINPSATLPGPTEPKGEAGRIDAEWSRSINSSV